MFSDLFLPAQRLVAAMRRPRRRQAGALCWRMSGEGFEVLLITTRRTGRWTPPKGNLIDGKSAAEAAAVEAWEEAGVIGAVEPAALGAYDFMKFRKDRRWEKMAVDVFPLEVEALEPDFPEAGEREAQWMSPADAAAAVRERALSRLIASFVPPVDG